MNLVWLAAPGIVLVSAPIVLLGLGRATREIARTRASIDQLTRNLRAGGEDVRDAAAALQSSMEAFRARGTLRSRLLPDGDPPVA